VRAGTLGTGRGVGHRRRVWARRPRAGAKNAPLLPGVSPSSAVPGARILRPRRLTPPRSGRLYREFTGWLRWMCPGRVPAGNNGSSYGMALGKVNVGSVPGSGRSEIASIHHTIDLCTTEFGQEETFPHFSCTSALPQNWTCTW